MINMGRMKGRMNTSGKNNGRTMTRMNIRRMNYRRTRLGIRTNDKDR